MISPLMFKPITYAENVVCSFSLFSSSRFFSLFLFLSLFFLLFFFFLFLYLFLVFYLPSLSLSRSFLLTLPTVERFSDSGSLSSCTLSPNITVNDLPITSDSPSGTLPSILYPRSISYSFLYFILVTKGDQQRPDSLPVISSLSSLAVNDLQRKPRLISDEGSNYSTSTEDEGDKRDVVGSSPDEKPRAKKRLFPDNDDSTSTNDKPRKRQTGKRLAVLGDLSCWTTSTTKHSHFSFYGWFIY